MLSQRGDWVVQMENWVVQTEIQAILKRPQVLGQAIVG